ncbi:hypothetical protein KBZ10_25350 [Streptomyces sp. F63]|nr:hypothetical protein [Streptomyces sp. F63]MBQ0987785.1 hypothetical protein [Streptomyces sp. F63]
MRYAQGGGLTDERREAFPDHAVGGTGGGQHPLAQPIREHARAKVA